jgi:hypothetical protein
MCNFSNDVFCFVVRRSAKKCFLSSSVFKPRLRLGQKTREIPCIDVETFCFLLFRILLLVFRIS